MIDVQVIERAGNRDLNNAWTVLERSGYVKLWVPPDLHDRVQDDYGAAMARGRHVLVNAVDGSEPVATAMATEMAPDTWLLHQLGKVPECRDPNVVIETIQELCSTVWRARGGTRFTIFAESEAPHTSRLFTRFSCALPPDDFDTSEVAIYRARCPSDVPGLRPGIPALMACASGGAANLAGLLNRCRFVVAARSVEERLDQLDKVVRYYGGQGARYFTFLDNPYLAPRRVPAGYERFGTGIQWQFRANVMGDWLKYLDGLRR